MKLYKLRRHSDVTGVSGTGDVGEICEYSDGRCVMRWVVRESPKSIVIYDNMDDLKKIHSHDGKTEIVAWSP